MSVSFSLLFEWLSSPAVVGVFAIVVVGVVLAIIFGFIFSFCAERDYVTMGVIFFILVVIVFVATIVCCVEYTEWVGAL